MRKLIVILALLAACTDSTNTSIEIPFALFASDETGSSTTGACTVSPATSGAAVFRESGLLELNPMVNPNAEYSLPLQVENYLSQQSLQDSNGNTIVGPNLNDFHVEKAVIRYIDIEGNLGVGNTAPAQDTSLISGVVRTGGVQAAAALFVTAVGANETIPWANALVSGGLTGVVEDVVLEVQIFGVLGSGEQAVSGLFHYPLQVCFNCGNTPFSLFGADGGSPYYLPNCPTGTTPIVSRHGPCGAPQDFEIVCVPAGAASGEPCQQTLGIQSGAAVSTGSTCFAAGSMPLTCKGGPPTGIEISDAIPFVFQAVTTCG